MNSKKNILVTGGAGFIGTHLCRLLVKQGHSVRVMDIRDPENRVTQVEYIKADVRVADQVRSAVSGVDAVYHLAAIVSVPLCQNEPVQSYETNLMSVVSMAQAVLDEQKRRGAGTRIRMVFSGSSAVYGMSGKKGIPISEEQSLPGPLSFYADQKRSAEEALRIFHRTHGLEVVNFRFFNVYGPGQDPTSPYSGVISIFTNRLRGSQSITLNASGEPTRDFVSVHDVAGALAQALTLPGDHCTGEPMNLGTGQAISILELADKMMKTLGKRSECVMAPPRDGDVPHSCAAIKRAEAVLGWTPGVPLEQGLSELLR